MGLTRQTVANALQAQVSGYTVATYLEGDQQIDIVFRLQPDQRADISQLETISIPTSKGAVPLSQIAHLDYTSEDNIIWRRNLRPTITVNGGIVDGVTGNDVTKQVYKELEPLRKELPAGMSIEVGGSLEDSNRYPELSNEAYTADDAANCRSDYAADAGYPQAAGYYADGSHGNNRRYLRPAAVQFRVGLYGGAGYSGAHRYDYP